ncbi:MAG: hypothetical protein GXO66_06515 [Euryarchaeota archaeon]|nr:hypothetical protein [Euryarchaeota archaeon]
MKVNPALAIVITAMLSLFTSFSMENRSITTEKDVYFPGEVIEAEFNFEPGVVQLITPAGVWKLEPEKRGSSYVARFELRKNVVLGEYTILAGGASRKVYVDSHSIEAEVEGGVLKGRVRYHVVAPGKVVYTLLPGNTTGAVEVGSDGRFTLELPENASAVLLSTGGAELEVKLEELEERELEVEEVYFPGEVVTVRANFLPRVAYVADPGGGATALRFHRQDGEYLANFSLRRNVVLGKYTLHADGLKEEFFVDFYRILASFNGTHVAGKVSYYFLPPSSIRWRAGGMTGEVEVHNGSFAFPLLLPPGNHSLLLTAGNAELTLNVSLGRGLTAPSLLFRGEEGRVLANFMPREALLVAPDNRTLELEFEEAEPGRYAAELPGDLPPGRYLLKVDGILREMVVDSYSIRASVRDGMIQGRVSWKVRPPEYVSYTVHPANMSGRAGVVNGSFRIPLTLPPGNYTAILSAGNARVELKLSIQRKLSIIRAYDPGEGQVVVKVEGDIEGLKPQALGIYPVMRYREGGGSFEGRRFLEYTLPATPSTLKNFGLPPEVLNTTMTVRRLSDTKLRVELSNKLEVWYRFKVELPPGYRVKEIVGDDGRRIVNNLTLNRLTGEVEGELRWYVSNGTLYFYDDPIWGYDITLTPPAPNNSIAIELAYSGTYSGGGQISAIIFPYSQGDNDTVIAQNDHAGRTEDNGYGNDIDIDAGSKVALRFTSGGVTRQYGNEYYYWYRTCWVFLNICTAYSPVYQTLGDDGNLTQLSRTDVALNTAPDGTLESVIITEMQTEGGEADITQKVIIRDNYRWFATIYYIKPTTDLTNLRFFQGMDWNFAGSYTGDDAYYNSTHDIVYGYDTNAPAGSIQYGGYGSDLRSSAHDVNYYTDLITRYIPGGESIDRSGMWGDIYRDALNNATTYTGDAATALAWDRASLAAGETWVVPVIWGLGFNFTDMVKQINAGKARLYDVGIKSIDTPANDSKFNPNVVQLVDFNATAALYGIVDQENVNVTLNITRIGGGYSYLNYTYVNLSVPFNETAQVSFTLNISGMPYGSYNVSFFTSLGNDQNRSNDLKWIIIHIVAFTVEPDQAKTASAGEEVLYNVTAGNYYSAGRFDVNITRSTKAWATRLYNGSQLIAEDTDGDSAWDYIAQGYDTNGNGIVDLFLPYGDTNITVAKLIPATAPLGEVDYTTLDFVSVSDPSVKDDVTLTTSTPLPPSQPKTFYLHGDMSMNTSRPTAAVSSTPIASNAQASWYQSPAFASDFTISGKVQVFLWLNSTSTGAQHTVTVSLLYTDGVTSTVLGTNSSRFAPGGTPSLHLFEITLDSVTTIPRNNYLVLRVENSQTGQTLYVHHTSSYNSNITLNTTTYVKVVEIRTDKQSYLPGEVALILANVTDPIGSYDITGANISVYYPNHTLYLQDAMSLNTTDSSALSLWKTFNYSLRLPVEGVYTIVVTGIESNGVVANLSREISAFVRVAGRVFEDLGVLGRAFNSSEDAGVANATVAIFRDDGDGVFDAGRDLPYAVARTSQGGGYNFSIGLGTYFVAVDSTTVNTTRGLNPGHSMDEIWAEQTFVTEWNGSAHVGSARFGGGDAGVSDAFGLIFFDDFESFAGWQNYSLGIVKQSSEVSYRGRYSLKKTANNDPNGGYKLIGSTVGRDVVLEGYTYRPSPWSGGSIDRIGLEDSGFNGYSFRVSHAGNYISIDRRTSGSATEISARVTWDPPENEWYYWRLFIFANGTITFSTYYENGTLAASVSASDSTYAGFDRVVVHGGYDYYVDNLYLRRMNARYEHIAKLNASAYANESIDLGFSFDVVVNARDGDDVAGSARSVQGSLRQFLLNANAVAGANEMRFIPGVPPNAGDASGAWWRIDVERAVGALPAIEDNGTKINGTALYANLSVRDENPGEVLSALRVGTGGDGIPGTGDEPLIAPFEKPELEVNLSLTNLVVGSAANASIAALALFNSNVSSEGAIAVAAGASDFEIRDNLLGARANGSAAAPLRYFAISVNESSSPQRGRIVHNYILAPGYSGIRAGRSSPAPQVEPLLLLVEQNYISGTGWNSIYSDGVIVYADNVTLRENYIASASMGSGSDPRTAGKGIEVRYDADYVKILNNTILDAESCGVLFDDASDSAMVKHNLISGSLCGVVAGSWSSPARNITISQNSIFNNSMLGIDLDLSGNAGDNVTLNDGSLNASQPNYGVDYPVITKAYLNGSELYLEGFLGNESLGASPAFGGASIEVFLVRNSTSGDDLRGNNYSASGALSSYYGEGWLYLGRVLAGANGRFNGSMPVAGGGVEELSYITATATLQGNGTSEFGRSYRLNLYPRGVSAAISVSGASAEINVTALSEQHGVYVYWLTPANITITSMGGDYDSHASLGELHRWGFDVIRAGETKRVLLNLSLSGDFSLMKALRVGVDPQ